MLLTSTKNTTETAKKEFELNKKKKQLYTATMALSHPKQVSANICRPTQRIKEIKI